MSLLTHKDFRSRSRHAKKITGGIWLIFARIIFSHNLSAPACRCCGADRCTARAGAEIGRKDHKSTDSFMKPAKPSNNYALAKIYMKTQLFSKPCQPGAIVTGL